MWTHMSIHGNGPAELVDIGTGYSAGSPSQSLCCYLDLPPPPRRNTLIHSCKRPQKYCAVAKSLSPLSSSRLSASDLSSDDTFLRGRAAGTRRRR